MFLMSSNEQWVFNSRDRPEWFRLLCFLSATTNVNSCFTLSFSLGCSVLALFSLSNSITAVGSPTCVYVRLFGYVHLCICLAYVRECVCLFLWPCAQERPTRERHNNYLFTWGELRDRHYSPFCSASSAGRTRSPCKSEKICTRNLFRVIKTKTTRVKW